MTESMYVGALHNLFTTFLPSFVYKLWGFVLQNIHIPCCQIYLEIYIHTHTRICIYSYIRVKQMKICDLQAYPTEHYLEKSFRCVLMHCL